MTKHKLCLGAALIHTFGLALALERYRWGWSAYYIIMVAIYSVATVKLAHKLT